MTTVTRAPVTVRLRRPWEPTQAAFIRSTAKRKVIRAGRRGGKTVGVATLAVEQFLAGRRILYGAPTVDQVTVFWFEVKRALADAIDAGIYAKNETDHSIDYPNTKQRIRAKTCWNAETLRGDYTDLLILDEYQLMNEDAWELVGAPMLLDNDGDAVFIYTPPSLHSAGVTKARDPRHASQMYKRALAEMDAARAESRVSRWEAFHFTSHANPHISQKALAEIVQDMTAHAIRQEIEAEDSDEAPGALWTRVLLDSGRVPRAALCDGNHGTDEAPLPCRGIDLARVVIGVDPPGGATECGIVIAAKGRNGQYYVLDDRSLRASPDRWAEAVLDGYADAGADRVLGEKNYGGDMVESTIRQAATARGVSMSFKAVSATRGKAVRAEPIAAMFEQGRVHLVGTLPRLEDEMCGWVPGQSAASPNRMDACLIGGTLVTTLRGDIPIEAVRVGDWAWTRAGWRRILAAQMTQKSARVSTIITIDGHTLTGTGNHPVWVQGKGFTPLNALVWGDILDVCTEIPLSTEVCSIVGTLRANAKRGGGIIPPRAAAVMTSCIDRFGRMLTELSHMATTSIMLTATNLTTTYPTSRVSAQRSTRVYTPGTRGNPGGPRDGAPTSPPSGRRQGYGTGLPKDAYGTPNTGGARGTGESQERLSALIAGRRLGGIVEGMCAIAVLGARALLLMQHITMISLWPVRCVRQCFGRTNTNIAPQPVRASVARGFESGIAPVYNLEVEDAHEYYANGILVHNCVWALTELSSGGAFGAYM